MAARTFEDSAGSVWEVFEVRRTSHKAEAVSAGLEHGWLAFVSGSRKRRLAPYPAEWQSADVAELERLCRRARAPFRIATREAAAPSSGDLPIEATVTGADSVEDTVRSFAHQARAERVPAVEAMVRLKALLARTFDEPTSPARDVRAVRHWFVEAYYFDKDATSTDRADQSR